MYHGNTLIIMRSRNSTGNFFFEAFMLPMFGQYFDGCFFLLSIINSDRNHFFHDFNRISKIRLQHTCKGIAPNAYLFSIFHQCFRELKRFFRACPHGFCPPVEKISRGRRFISREWPEAERCRLNKKTLLTARQLLVRP